MAPYKTRRVAADTRSLPFEGARWVDEQLAARVDGFGLPTIERLVALAAARYAPEEQAEKEQQSRSRHHVTLTHPRPGDFAGTSWLEAAGDTQDLTAFYALVCAEAKHLGRLGDTDDYETRKAKALGIIAARQGTLDLTAEAPDGQRVTRRPVQTHLYVHVSLADLATHLAGAPAVGEVEKLGPATLDLIEPGCSDSKATIQPVLDLNRTDAVDQHDPPPGCAEQVILRDRHCVFPWCGRDARRCDLDHIVPYVPPDEGGPPGQTNPQNLAPLCRRHHRAKTFTGWTYQRDRDGTYTWTSPHGHTWTVGPDGTCRHERARPPAAEPRRTPSPPDTAGRCLAARIRAPVNQPNPHSDGHFLRLTGIARARQPRDSPADRGTNRRNRRR